MKKVILAALGSYGDLHPILGVALALKARGAHPVIASHPDYAAKVEAAGLDFHPCGPSFQDLKVGLGLTPAAVIDRMARDQAFLHRHFVAATLDAWIEAMTPVVEDADVVVGTSLAYGADIVAQTFAKPFVTAALSPAILLSALDPPKWPGAPLILKPKNAWARGINRTVLALGKRKMASALSGVNAAYRRAGLAPDAGVAGVVSGHMTLALYSPLLMGPQSDNPPNTRIVGFPFYDSENGRPVALDPKLDAFLGAGPPPVVFSLGSVVVHDGEAFYRTAIAVAAALKQRCVVLCGLDSPLLGVDFGPDVCMAAYAPHSLLFPRVRAIVHHGGIGSTGQALRAGKPQLITPAFVDQFDNGWRCERLGVAKALNYKDWTKERATRALKLVLESPAMAARAVDVATAIARETGADTAADLILEV